jgi:hypothetical protein
VQCPPCHAHYRPDQLLKLETWQQDAEALLRSGGILTNRSQRTLIRIDGFAKKRLEKSQTYPYRDASGPLKNFSEISTLSRTKIIYARKKNIAKEFQGLPSNAQKISIGFSQQTGSELNKLKKITKLICTFWIYLFLEIY